MPCSPCCASITCSCLKHYDPQVAAVEQWLKVRRLRGAVAGGRRRQSPHRWGLTCAVQAQMLDVLREMSRRLADVKRWQSELRVVNNLQDTRAGFAELKQVR